MGSEKALVVAALAGFIGTFLEHDIALLQERGYEVHCAGNVSGYKNEETMARFEKIGTVFHRIDFASRSPLSKQNMVAFKQIRKLLKEHKYDVIHCHTPIPGVIVRLAALPYRRKGTKVIYTSHGFFFHKGSGKKEWLIYHTIEKIMSAFGDAIITINNEDYEVAKKMFSKKAFHINGVGCNIKKYQDVEVNCSEKRKSLGILDSQIMILDVGELSKRKNHSIVIEALGEIKDPNLVLVICGKAIEGSGTYESLKKLAEELRVNVIFAGHRMDVPELCHCADFGVLPSTREGLGMSAIEMMSTGLPLVTSNVHGIKDYMIQGKTGYMCDPYDKKQFAEGIRSLCSVDTREEMKAHCIASAERFDQRVSFAQMKEIYDDILMNE